MGSYCMRRFLPATRTITFLTGEKCSPQQTLQHCYLSNHTEPQIADTPNLGDVKVKNPTIQDVSKMPGPRVLPGLGTEWTYGPFGPYSIDQIHTAKLEMREDYGSIYKEKLGGHWIVNIHNVDDIQTMFRNEGPRPIRSVNQALVYYRRHSKYCPQYEKHPSIVDMSGEEWYNIRSKANPVLMRTDTRNIWASKTSEVADIWISHIKQTRTLANIIPDIITDLRRFALDAASRIILGYRIGFLDKTPPPHTEKMLEQLQMMTYANNTLCSKTKWHLWKYFPTPAWKKLVAVNTELDRLFHQEIQKHKKGQESKMFDESVLAKFQEQTDYNEAQIRALIYDLLSGSSETSAAFMARVLHRLGQEPRVQKNLQRELDIALEDSTQKLTLKALSNMPYLKATIKESYRLLTIIPGLLRIAPKKLELQGYEIPAYTPVVAQTYTECLREENFIRPMEFIPERWLNTKDLTKQQIQIYEKQVGDLDVLRQETRVSRALVLPFSLGARSCVGRRIVEAEVNVFLAKVMLNFNIESRGELGLECVPFMNVLPPVKMLFKDR